MIPLVRRWAVDWLASHNPAAVEGLLDPGYRLRIGSVELVGREEYLAGTLGQLRNYPGLVLTVHEVISSGDLAAVAFTEHGAAVNRDGARAAWMGVAIHRAEGGVLVQSWAEEDYAGRSRQLSTGLSDPIQPPAVAPWDTQEDAPDPRAEGVVREWLAAGASPSPTVRFDSGDDAGALLPALEMDVLFSSGSRVAFHGRARHADEVVQGVSGLVAVDADGEVSGRIVTDRAGAVSARKRRG